MPKRRKELIRLQPCGPLLPGLESLDRLRLKPRSEIKSEDGRVLNAKKAAVDRKEEGDDSLKVCWTGDALRGAAMRLEC